MGDSWDPVIIVDGMVSGAFNFSVWNFFGFEMEEEKNVIPVKDKKKKQPKDKKK